MRNWLILISLVLIFALTGCKQLRSNLLVTTSPVEIGDSSTSTTTPMLSPMPETGNDVRNPMSFQLTKEQIKVLFGEKYTELTDAMTGEWKVWRFDVEPKNGYKADYDVFGNGNVDMEGLKSHAIKCQVFVTWDTEGKLIGIDSYYLQNGEVSQFGLSENILKKAYSTK
ncbi:hypothetical protein GCM10008018_42340 [Paenibacillus marchantiophytorum]|uniref:Lipoprotein n=1 Tax=Paenibacillus marchantiophytorum TaxID=1619310 RepID=A0ABQ1EX80_9BACL|nr:hypothetical protein [Paenibacillus marchantiophytorum]GFZ91589.1 hypothetical protein GCM10008018_42340 [Paenibacillus marchantiophytorum]